MATFKIVLVLFYLTCNKNKLGRKMQMSTSMSFKLNNENITIEPLIEQNINLINPDLDQAYVLYVIYLSKIRLMNR